MKKFLLYAVIITIITIRFFTEELKVLPRFFNFVDIGFFLVFAVYTFLHLAIAHRRLKSTGLEIYVLLFGGICFVSTFLNIKDIYWKASLLQIFMLLEPIVLALMIVKLNHDEKFLQRIVILLIILGLIQIPIALFQIQKYLAGASPDVVAGTFGVNNSQLSFFLIIFSCLIIGINLFYNIPRFRYLLLTLPFVLVIFYAGGYRAMWIFFPATIIILLLFFSPLNIPRKVFYIIPLLVISFLIAVYISSLNPISASGVFKQLIQQPSLILQTGKVKAFRYLPSMFSEKSHYVFVGVGPGAYASRAFDTFANISKTYSNVTTQYISSSYVSPMASKYIYPMYLEESKLMGSRTFDDPTTSYLSILAESGILGFILIFLIYYKALKLILEVRRNVHREFDKFHKVIAFASLGALLFLFQMSFFADWFATYRVTIPTWILLSILYTKKASLRRHAVRNRRI